MKKGALYKVGIGIALMFTLVSMASVYARDPHSRPLDADTSARPGPGVGPAPGPVPSTMPIPAPSHGGAGMPTGGNGAYRGGGGVGVGNNGYYPPPGYVYNPRYYYFQNWYYPSRCSLFFSQLQFLYGESYPSLFPMVRSNQELFLTKDSVKTALRESMDYANQLTRAFAELEKITQGQAATGNQNTKEVRALTAKIRDLSSKIRKDTFLNLLDMRKDTEVIKDKGNTANREAEVEKLGELIAQLHEELSSMYNDRSPGVVSIKSYSSPSVRSITKGIERLTKRIESNKRS